MGDELPALPEAGINSDGVYSYCDDHMHDYAKLAIAKDRIRFRSLAEKWRMEADQLGRQARRSQRRGDDTTADVLFQAAMDVNSFADQLIQVAEGREP